MFDNLFIIITTLCFIVIILFRYYSNFTADKTVYSLGNIIGKSYADDPSAIEIAASNPGKFGHFLSNRKKLVNKDMNDCWWDNMDNYVKTYPEFNNHLRSEIKEYKDWQIPSTPSTPDTCVVHMRVGDFIAAGQNMDPELIVKAVSKLPRTPDRIEILNGGTFHSVRGETQEKDSLEILEKLEKSIKVKFPSAEVVKIDNSTPDNDFYRMVNAPMLVTGLGSFATMAAAANKNFRLTPEFTVNDKDQNVRPQRKLLEDWHTYTSNSLDS